MKYINLMVALLLLPLSVVADAWETQYKQIEKSIRQPEFKDKCYDITK